MESGGIRDTFEKSWELLKGNVIIVVPGILALIAHVLLRVFFAPLMGGIRVTSGSFVHRLLAGVGMGMSTVLSIVYALATMVIVMALMAYTTAMAAAAWDRGSAHIMDGIQAFAKNLTPLGTAFGLLGAGFIVAFFLISSTFSVSLLVFLYFSVYTLPSVIVGRRGGVEAFVESARIGMRYVAVAGSVTLGYAVGIGVSAVICLPVFWIFGTDVGCDALGFLIALLYTYFTVVVVGEYQAMCELLPSLTGRKMP